MQAAVDAVQAIGIQAVHTGPMKQSGGINCYTYTPSVDGNFDRISFEIDPQFGTLEQYKSMVRVAQRHGAITIGDVIPGHTGKGADFLLAERAYRDYPGLYHMVQIDSADWGLLPPVPAGHNSVNLSPAIVDTLQRKHYIVGMLSSRIFYVPGVKDSDWSATDIVPGVDGIKRRWVYLHYFKEGQPTLDWLDPSFAAQRMITGDAIHQLAVLGDFGRDFEAADIGRAHQKLGAEIAADEIAAAMGELVIRAVEAAADFIAPARWEKAHARRIS